MVGMTPDEVERRASASVNGFVVGLLALCIALLTYFLSYSEVSAISAMIGVVSLIVGVVYVRYI